MKFLKSHSSEFKTAATGFEEAGRAITVADTVVATYVVMQADAELTEKLLEFIDNDSELWKGLLELQKAQESGFGIRFC